MAKSANQKTKLLRLAQLLLSRTDEEHPMSTPQLIQELAKYDISAERKSIYDDMETLRTLGLDVQNRKGTAPGWFIAGREFELPELKLLVDAVQSSRFLTRKKSDALIRKLEGLTSVHQAQQLQRQVYVSGRVKVMNESIYYNVDKLHTAIARRLAITFRYFDYDVHKNKVFRRDGAQYAVSPFGLIWSSDFYYLAAFDHQHGQMRHYRVDKMAEITVTSRPRQGEDRYPNFDLAVYGQKHFGMFAGEEAAVTLRCRSRMVGVVLDRFGREVILVPDGEDHFTVTLPLVVSPQFFGWLFGLEDNVELLGPPTAVEAYRRSLSAVSALYEKQKRSMNMDDTMQSCRDFTALLASSAPAPGGGGAAALTGALGAALVHMVGALTVGKAKYAPVEEELCALMAQCQELRTQLLDQVEADAEGFLPLAQAYRIPKDGPARETALEEASLAACAAPLRIMELCGKALEISAVMAEKGSPLAVSDAGCAAALLNAAMEAASLNVFINTKGMQDRKQAAELNIRCLTMLDQYGLQAHHIFRQVQDSLLP